MSNSPRPPHGTTTCATDHLLAARIGLLLRIGVLASATVLLVGGTVYLIRNGGDAVADRTEFTPGPPEYSRPKEIWQAATHGGGRPIIQLGLLLLIATPVLRVAFTVVAFARRRDWLYVGIAAVVLGVLMYGLLSGQVHG